MKKSIGKVPLIYPLPLAIIGLETDAGFYAATVRNMFVPTESPPTIGIILEDKHTLNKHLKPGVKFSINIPSTTMIDKADLMANSLSEDFDKSELFTVKNVMNTPYIDECPVALLVEYSEHQAFRKQRMYICEVKSALVEETLFVAKNVPSMNILDPIIYGHDQKYYQIGHVIGKVDVEGKLLYQEIRKKMPPIPYGFHFKHKICRLKDQGVSYKELSSRYGVYHETIEDWYTLYSIYGKEGLTKKMAIKLAKTQFSPEEKEALALKIIHQDMTYRELCERHTVSLSRLKNWVKRTRKKMK